MNSIDFSRNLIKGRIAETIFEEMFRQSGEFTVIPIGYEHTIPELAQYQHHVHVKRVLENIRHAPDFALISQDRSQVFLVEVKFRNTLNPENILAQAIEINQRWNPCFLFLATLEEFYFDSCFNIIQNLGSIKLLDSVWITTEIQKSYVTILQEFIKMN